MEKRFFEDIEKLRGIACVLVLIQHIALIVPLKFVYTILNPYLLVGSGGVHIFFAITGFVITMSLRNKGLFQDERLFVDRFNLHKYTLVDFYKKRFCSFL